MASPALVTTNVNTMVFVTGGTSITKSLQTGGNVHLALMAVEPGKTPTAPSGWTLIGSLSIGDQDWYAWWALDSAAPGTTWTFSSALTQYAELRILAISGAYTAAPIESSAFSAPATATGYTPPARTSLSTDTLSLCFAANWSVGWSTPTAPSGYTARVGGDGGTGNFNQCGGELAVAAPATITPGAIVAGSSSLGAALHIVVASQAAAGGTSLNVPLLTSSAAVLVPSVSQAAGPYNRAPVPEPLPARTSRDARGPIARSVPPFWPPREIPRSLVNPATPTSLSVPLLTSTADVVVPSVFAGPPLTGLSYSPTIPGEYQRKVPPFWPPSQIPRSTSALGVASVSLSVPLLSSTAATVAPSLSVSQSAPLLLSTAAALAPGLAVSLGAPALTSAAAPVAPSLAVSDAVPLLSAAATTLAPSLGVSVSPGVLTSAATLPAPALSVSLGAPLLSSSAAVLVPVVNTAGSTNLTPPLLSSTAAPVAPVLTVSLAGALLTSSAAPLAPTVTRSLPAPLLSGSATTPAPGLAVGFQASTLASAAATVAPALSAALQAPVLASGAVVLAPTVSQVGTTQLTPPVLTSTAAPVAPSSVTVQLQLALVAAASSLPVPSVSQAGAVNVTPPVLASSAAVLAPRADVSLSAPLFAATSLPLPPYSVDGSLPVAPVGGTDVVLWDGLGGVSLDAMRVRGKRGR